MKNQYSSPQAYLNRFFKGKSKFKMTISEYDYYTNAEWEFTHVESEFYELARRTIDRDTGWDGFDYVFDGTLIECVAYIKNTKRSET